MKIGNNDDARVPTLAHIPNDSRANVKLHITLSLENFYRKKEELIYFVSFNNLCSNKLSGIYSVYTAVYE